MKRWGCIAAIFIVAGLLVPAPAVHAKGIYDSCEGTGRSYASAGDLTVFLGYDPCEGVAACPSTSANSCTVRVNGDISGDGVVGMTVFVAGEARDNCLGGSTCSTEAVVKLAPGEKAHIYCETEDGVALDFTIGCDWITRYSKSR